MFACADISKAAHGSRHLMMIIMKMTKRAYVLISIVLFICFAIQASPADRVPPKDSVVIIYIDDRTGRTVTSASGFIIDRDGVIATTHAVLSRWLAASGGNLFVKTVNGALFQIDDIVSVDKTHNIALFRINAQNLSSVSFFPEYRPVMNDEITVIGSPSGADVLISSGTLHVDKDNVLLQVTPGLSPGNSGSPVFNRENSVVGIVHVFFDDLGTRYGVIPVAYASRLLDKYKNKKNKMAPYIKKRESDEPQPVSPEIMESLLRAQSVVRKDPNSEEALSHLAWSYIHAGMHEEAADAYEQIIGMDPYNVDSYNNLGVVYGKYLGMPEKAVSHFKKALRIKPDADIHANLGSAYLDLGMYREALEEYKRAIQARPYYDRAHFGLGISFLRLNDQGAALKEYEILKKLNPALADELSVYLSAPAVPVQTK